MKSITELLNSESTTLEDWYHYAQSICLNIDFTGADDSTPKLVQRMEDSLSIQKLSLSQLKTLLIATQGVLSKKSYAADDEFQIISWGIATNTVIKEELDRRLQQLENGPLFSLNNALLLEIISVFSVAQHNRPEQLFPTYSHYFDPEKFLSTHTQQVKTRLTTETEPEISVFLQKEVEYLTSQVTTEDKLLRQWGMLDNLTSFKTVLSDYKQHVEQSFTDSTKTKKLAIITTLDTILHNNALLLPMKIYEIEKIIHNDENKAILLHDSWGERIIHFIQDSLSIFFTKAPLSSDHYKAQLFALKQDNPQTLENTAPSDESEPQSVKSNSNNSQP